MICRKLLITLLAIMAFATATFAADGGLDAAFNPGLSSSSFPEVTHVAVTADGKIMIAGYFTSVSGVSRNGIARLNADGTLDASFDPGTGIQATQVDSMAIAPDGKIIVGGLFTSFSGTARKNIVRINTDGTIDAAFNPGTIATSRINALAIQPDGKVLVGIALSTIKRLNTDGSLDTGFTTTMTPQVGVLEIKLQSDGKIMIGGGWDFLNGADFRFGLARLNDDGSTDSSFVPHHNDFTLYRASVAEILPQADGKVVAVGNLAINSSSLNKHIVRFNSDGTVDDTFNSGVDANNTIWSVYRQPNGKYIIGGNFVTFNSVASVGIARLNGDGTLDTSFTAGINASARVEEIVPYANGKILISGTFSQVNSTSRICLARIQNIAANKAAICDYDGDGMTDFAVRRVASQQFFWYIGLSSGGNLTAQWGKSGDSLVCGDFDGDNKTDLTVWRFGAPLTAGFYILQSSTNTLRFEQFGQSLDDPTMVGDYDGDGITDVAVYRRGAAAGDQSYFYYRGSLNNPNGTVTYVPWGVNGDRPYVGDFDGDGKTDVAVQRTENSVGVHYILQSSNGSARVAYFGNGSSGDSIVPGDYNGDGRTDIAVRRTENGSKVWYVTTDFGATLSSTVFGTTNSLSAVGDYDGDGKSDVAVYQNDTSGGGYHFFVLKSSDGSSLAYRWGQNLDFPVAGSNQH